MYVWLYVCMYVCMQSQFLVCLLTYFKLKLSSSLKKTPKNGRTLALICPNKTSDPSRANEERSKAGVRVAFELFTMDHTRIFFLFFLLPLKPPQSKPNFIFFICFLKFSLPLFSIVCRVFPMYALSN